MGKGCYWTNVIIKVCWILCRTTRFATFPDYLMVQMAKFSFGEDWVPKKYGMYKRHGLQILADPVGLPL